MADNFSGKNDIQNNDGEFIPWGIPNNPDKLQNSVFISTKDANKFKSCEAKKTRLKSLKFTISNIFHLSEPITEVQSVAELMLQKLLIRSLLAPNKSLNAAMDNITPIIGKRKKKFTCIFSRDSHKSDENKNNNSEGKIQKRLLLLPMVMGAASFSTKRTTPFHFNSSEDLDISIFFCLLWQGNNLPFVLCNKI